MSTKKLQIVTPIVTSVNGQTGDVTLDISGGGTGNMKKLTFTGAVTGEYDGTTDVSVDIPSDVYVVQFDANDILVNDYAELENAIKNGMSIIIKSSDAMFFTCVTSMVQSSLITLVTELSTDIYIAAIDKTTKKVTTTTASYVAIENSADVPSKSGFVYHDKDTDSYSIKDITLPIATASTTGTIKVGNGLSISDDGTLSVTTATYYTGVSDPVNTLGVDGDLYLKMYEDAGGTLL